MKTINIRFNDYLANWITSCCQKNKITFSEFIRDLLYERMRSGEVKIDRYKINKTRELMPKNSRTEIGYIIFAAKLLEGFVLATQGEELTNAAFKETEQVLRKLNLNNDRNKKQRFSFMVEQPLYLWLCNEAFRLQIVGSKLIRHLIEDVYLEDHLATNVQVTELEKSRIEYQITTCKLLEALINDSITDSDQIIEKARHNAKEIILKLYQDNKSLVNA